ncbi:hypothetical protein [Micromonospora sp. WMMD1155]|uniref:hypothetical protein n=1 Tax=Micromonospora sp. WMMD1155 TaxID=3016094 RepID=UPI00249AAFDD|nr:hypothetical protein [Micromonospora sp. WMMD1155]WFE53621.1 hypothetical protein O7617_26290 [Micromonospora sp. WMMD1155]
MAGGFQVDPGSLTGAAATLHDLARQLQTGQIDLFVLDWADDPASHPDLAQAMRRFAEFAHDQHQDVVALLAALSLRVAASADNYEQTEATMAADMNTFLTQSTYQPADQRSS